MSDDFCGEHGYEFMKSVMGNPVPYCTACDDARQQENERAAAERERNRGGWRDE